ncbi:hypothetical protein CVT26_002599 [Gymnopilus dilepis]|uniref:Transmembrane protein n=1 Tax=Gymnopilus dilepis TaxID=231916 RepID=A0A409VF63_9AGAR|nr:hypothetical protein CVT26_002599 [Gymnopilus dilepis]
MASARTPSVFVDDSDPRIVYQQMAPDENVRATDIAQFATSPIYGTLHATTFLSGTFTFDFEGTSIGAFFTSNSTTSALKTCVVDNVQQDVVLEENGASVVCQTSNPLQPGKHTLIVSITTVFLDEGDLVLFDYIQYTPSGADTSGEDIVYYTGDPTIKLSSSGQVLETGGTLDLDFIGYSLSVFVDFSSADSHSPSNVSYAIDGGEPLIFTIENFASTENSDVDAALVLQTPVFSAGQHHLHLIFLGSSETVPFNLNRIIVQNSNFRTSDLNPFPPISSVVQGQINTPSSSSVLSGPPVTTPAPPIASSLRHPISSVLPPSSSNQSAALLPSGRGRLDGIHLGLALGIAVAVIGCLICCLCIFIHRRRKMFVPSDGTLHPDVFARPYLLPKILRLDFGNWRIIPGRSPEDQTKHKRRCTTISPPRSQLAAPAAAYVDAPKRTYIPDNSNLDLPPAYGEP